LAFSFFSLSQGGRWLLGAGQGKGKGEAKRESAALARGAFHPDFSTMGFNNVAGDGQAQTGASAFSRLAGINSLEFFKD
jgi:hypothetical protein